MTNLELNKLVRNLEKRNFKVYVVDNKESASKQILDLIENNSSISWGGSVTLDQIKIKEYLAELKSKKNLKIYDRSTAKNPEEVKEIYNKAFSCDYYLTSANALLTDGRIVNIDGRGNRVAATIYGPSKVIFIIGRNKIVDGNIDDAISRVKNVASPLNVKRLEKTTTGCYITGKCTDCSSEERICRNIAITEWGKYFEEKIIVILVNEDLGY